MRKLPFALVFACFALCACVGPRISGVVNARAYSQPPEGASFRLAGKPDKLNMTAMRARELVVTEMEQRGFKQTNEDSAQLLVAFSVQIGPGRTRIWSQPDFVVGGHSVGTSTSYLRTCEVIVLDAETTTEQDPAIVWQGELKSRGSQSNTLALVELFVPVLFEQFGQSVTDRTHLGLLAGVGGLLTNFEVTSIKWVLSKVLARSVGSHFFLTRLP